MSAARKKDWILTQEAFEGLLTSLDSNRERAGVKYENLRRKLIEFFEARGISSPDRHADETINRVARKLGEGERVQDLNRYSYGVARLLLKETLRARATEPIELDFATAPAATEANEESEDRRRQEDLRLECFEACMSSLSLAQKVLIVEYYREEQGVKTERRKLQAEALGMSLNALRLRACRIRAELADCISSCLSRG